jgi:TonB family protein
MRSPNFITGPRWRTIAVAAIVFTIAAAASGQRIAVVTPDDLEQSRMFAGKLTDQLTGHVQVLDEQLARSAFDSFHLETPFNLSTEDSKKIAAAIGCDFIVLVRSSTLRRSSSERAEYYDANAAIFLVSRRTGRLSWFGLLQREAAKPETAVQQLLDEAGPAASLLIEKIGATVNSELNEPPPPPLEEVPDAAAPAARNFRAPVPYRRVKPNYTADAAYYDIRSTVDVEVDLNADGSIAATRIVRWAGYGLERSVEQAVRSMNWRPAERNGKPLAMRFLVRYNFKKTEQ